MSASENEGTGFGPILWTVELSIVGVLVLIALFLPKDTTVFFIQVDQQIRDFLDSPFLITAKFISGLLIVGLASFATWLFFMLLEMEKEHEEHVYHHAEHLHADHHTQAQVSQPKTANDQQIKQEKIQNDSKHDLDVHTQSKTAPPPNRLPGESGVRGAQEGTEHPGHYQWQSVLRLATSNNPSDWKLAIIEADVILDMMTYMQGFPGATLGERLKNADPGYFKTLKYAKQAHHMRNQIAHEGDLQLTPRDVNQTIRMYEAVFDEYKYI
jgi:hypothetical protein